MEKLSPEDLQRHQEERAQQAKLVKASYRELKDTPALKDVLEQLTMLMESHLQVAKAGVGTNGKEVIRHSNEERLSHLDKAAGLEELHFYLSRQLDD